MKKVNQYGPSDPVFQKCAAEGCDNQIRRTPCERKKGHHMYCSAGCAYQKAMEPRKYDAKTIAWIKENYTSMTFEDMARKLHSGVSSLKRMLCKLRANGHDIPRKSKSVLTDTQTRWIADNFNSIPIQEMSKAMNIQGNIIKSWLDHKIKNGSIIRTKSFKPVKKDKAMPRVTSSFPPDGRETHRNRKPPVNDIPTGTRPMDQRLPTRKVDLSECIKVMFKDKNRTTMYARDEDHVARIRKTYANFEAFGSELVYP